VAEVIVDDPDLSRSKSMAATKLAKYQEMRDFAQTGEPSGNDAKVVPSKALRFVIQKHAASHLHFDLRLEYEGTFRSWAVPKAPSLDPKDWRMAMEVEDHPLDYGDFEGTIPKGQYGGGTVMLWDRGYWAPEKGFENIGQALAKGELNYAIARGQDDRAVNPNRERKSSGSETTFEEDSVDPARIEAGVLAMADHVWAWCEKTGGRGRTVTVKIKWADFQQSTRSQSLSSPVDSRATLLPSKFGDHLRAECREVIGLARGHQPAIDDHLLIGPVGPGITQVGFQRRP
jgi:DNA ligase D-like protein (predicted 3'-phosphoesterase)